MKQLWLKILFVAVPLFLSSVGFSAAEFDDSRLRKQAYRLNAKTRAQVREKDRHNKHNPTGDMSHRRDRLPLEEEANHEKLSQVLQQANLLFSDMMDQEIAEQIDFMDDHSRDLCEMRYQNIEAFYGRCEKLEAAFEKIRDLDPRFNQALDVEAFLKLYPKIRKSLPQWRELPVVNADYFAKWVQAKISAKRIIDQQNAGLHQE